MSERKKCVLAILDGWGISKNPNVSAISSANTPFFDHLMNNYPNAELLTHGNNVGLPDGQMGNSEVGHINIGAGRIVYQELARINKEIDENQLKNVSDKFKWQDAAYRREKENERLDAEDENRLSL